MARCMVANVTASREASSGTSGAEPGVLDWVALAATDFRMVAARQPPSGLGAAMGPATGEFVMARSGRAGA
jgi:hypothetical protein